MIAPGSKELRLIRNRRIKSPVLPITVVHIYVAKISFVRFHSDLSPDKYYEKRTQGYSVLVKHTNQLKLTVNMPET